jgi:hypothetical protein
MKYEDLVKLITTPVFSKNDIILGKGALYDYQLTRWVKKGYLLKLKNGIYAFNKDYGQIRGEAVATVLYQPSYLSMESALSYYGFIPEMVYTYVSVTSKTNSTLFWGYEEVKTDTGRYLIAEPEKAVLDYLYLNLSKINNEADFMNLRFNEDRIGEILNREKFFQYLQVFGLKKMTHWAHRCLP